MLKKIINNIKDIYSSTKSILNKTFGKIVQNKSKIAKDIVETTIIVLSTVFAGIIMLVLLLASLPILISKKDELLPKEEFKEEPTW